MVENDPHRPKESKKKKKREKGTNRKEGWIDCKRVCVSKRTCGRTTMARIHVRSKLVEGAELVKKKKVEHHLDRAPFQLMYLLAMGSGYRCVPTPTNPTTWKEHGRNDKHGTRPKRADIHHATCTSKQMD